MTARRAPVTPQELRQHAYEHGMGDRAHHKHIRGSRNREVAKDHQRRNRSRRLLVHGTPRTWRQRRKAAAK